MKKIIFIAVPVGRAGSSMVTGILHKAGVNAGSNPCSAKSPMNPGGFYEVREVREFYYDHYYDHMNPHKPMYSYEKMRDMQPLRDEYLKILDATYGSKYPIVVKALDYIGISFFEDDPEYDVRVICLGRKKEDQARSIRSAWSNKGPTSAWWTRWLDSRYEWCAGFRREFDFPYLYVDFNEVLDDPREQAVRMMAFCDIPVQGLDEIEKWVNPSFSRSRS